MLTPRLTTVKGQPADQPWGRYHHAAGPARIGRHDTPGDTSRRLARGTEVLWGSLKVKVEP